MTVGADGYGTKSISGVVILEGDLVQKDIGLQMIDLCPDDLDKIEPGRCGCGVPETDSDQDGSPDCVDLYPDYPMGDIGGNGNIDLMDVILVLQTMAGMETSSPVFKEADVNADVKIGLEEAIYVLRKLVDTPEPLLIKSSIPYNDSPDYAEENVRTVVNGFNAFTLDFYHEVIKGENNQGKNVFFSAYSIENALAMTWAGAKNTTAQQMAEALHLNLPPETFHPTLNALNLDLNRRDDQPPPSGDAFEMNLVNAIWSRIGYPFLPPYLDVIAQNYNAGIRALDFRSDPDGSRLIINQWVEDQTNEKIKDLLPERSITVDTALVLTNAIYFKASWFLKFDPENTKSGNFTRLDGSTVSAQMMHQIMDTKIFQTDDFDAVKLPYISPRFGEGQYPEEFSMLFIVPRDGAFLKVENSLTLSVIDTIIASLAMGEVDLLMPKFQFTSETSCKEILRNLGMVDAFEPVAADFSGMVNPVDSKPWIDQVYHKAFIGVDEEGTQAAAATAVVMTDTSMPDPVVIALNRPFIFLIHDNITGAVLFMGRVLDPGDIL
jgi:serpin B